MEAHQDAGATALQAALQLYGVVAAGVEDEQRNYFGARFGQPTKQPLDLLYGGLVGVLFGTHPPRVDRRHP